MSFQITDPFYTFGKNANTLKLKYSQKWIIAISYLEVIQANTVHHVVELSA